MKIIISSFGKQFGYTWIFKNLNYTFNFNQTYTITGPNGSGKSSLLLCLCQYINSSEGALEWVDEHNKKIDEHLYHNYFSICSPHSELPNELKVRELLYLNAQLQRESNPKTFVDKILTSAYLEKYLSNYIYQLSSGTIARIKLALAFHCKKPILLLDEFSGFLDDKAKQWAFNQFKKNQKGKLIIISSNDKNEIALCKQQISLRG